MDPPAQTSAVPGSLSLMGINSIQRPLDNQYLVRDPGIRKFASKTLTGNVFTGCLERRQAVARYYGLGRS